MPIIMMMIWITRSLLLLLLPLLNPHPGEKGTETAERDMRIQDEKGIAIVRELLSGPYLGSLQLVGRGFP